MMVAARADAMLMTSNVTDQAPRTYQERLESGWCTREGCDEQAGDGSNECARHQLDSKKRRRRHRTKMRRIWAAQKLCMRCGGKRRKGSKWCSPCLVKCGKLRIADRDRQRDKAEDRTTHNVEGDGYARARFRGQARRGQQPWSQLDRQDIEDAIARLEKAKVGLLYFETAEVQAMPRIQRDEIKLAALGQAAHAGRFVDEVLDRNRYEAKIAESSKKTGR